MGNPTSGCTVTQVSMSLSKRRHRQSLSLQLEQVEHLESIKSCEKKKSASLASSPRVTEEATIASFLGAKQVTRKKPSSLSGAEDYLKSIELSAGVSSAEDRKPTSFNPFRGHRRVGSGSIISTCKSLESIPREKGGSLSFRKESGGSSSFRKEVGGSSFRREGVSSSFRKDGGSSFRKEAGGSSSFRKEAGGSSSFRKDKLSVAKLAASLFHSPTKLERSLSMSRLAQKGKPEEVVSLRTKYQRSSDDACSLTTELSGDKECNSDTSAKDMEAESARSLISNASSQQRRHQCVIDITKTLTGQGEEESFSTTAIEDPQLVTGVPSVYSQVFVNAAERVPSNLSEASFQIGTSNHELVHSDRNLDDWTKSLSLSHVTRTSTVPFASENYCSPIAFSDRNSESGVEASPKEPPSVGSQSSRMAWVDEDQPCGLPESKSILSIPVRPLLGSFHSEPERYLLPLGASFSEETREEKIAADDLQSLLFTTEKVTEEELTEAAVLSSLMSEEYLSSPAFMSSEKSRPNLLTSSSDRHTPVLSPSTRSESGLKKSPCNSDACLKKCMSFEPVARDKSKAEGDRKAKLRKRRRSVSASGIGAMLLKVVRVSDSGPIITRRLPKVGPEVISGAEALRAREYVLQKTAQISMGRASESSSPASALSPCQCASENGVKPTYPMFEGTELGTRSDRVEQLVQQSSEAREGVDDKGCGGTGSPLETPHRNQQTTSEGLPEVISRDIPDLENTNSGSACILKATIPTFQEKVERVNSSLRRQTKSVVSAVGNAPSASTEENADERRSGKPKKKSRSRGRSNSIDFDSLPENPQKENAEQAALSILDPNVAISRERSRSFVSRLQAPSGIASADVYRLAPSSISILANPSFSSSHQDRLWEEQAEAYSSGGRGTPGREDEPAAANIFLHSPSPGAPISSDDHPAPSASASSRRGLIDTSAGPASTVSDPEKGKQKKKGQGKKRGRPHTPLRSLLADDLHSKSSNSATRASPEGGHFFQQIMARIRGTSSKSLSPKSPDAVVKRRSTWSSCICFSVK